MALKVINKVFKYMGGCSTGAISKLTFFKGPGQPKLQSSSSSSTSSGSGEAGSHPGMPSRNWSLHAKVAEEIWVRDKEKEESQDTALLKARLHRDELLALEGQLEDILVDEFTTPQAKAKLVDWKVKMFECLAATRPGVSPLEMVAKTQEDQVSLLTDLENLLHIEGIDISDKTKRALVNWKMQIPESKGK